MDFQFTEEQEEIRKQVRALCARFPDEYWRERDESAEPHGRAHVHPDDRSRTACVRTAP